MGTACLEASSGSLLWQSQELQFDHEVGPGQSPALHGDLLLFNCDGTDVQFGAALDKKTGALAWKTNRSGVIDKPNDRKKAFVTPLVISDGRRELVIMTAAEWVYAYDPATGREIWNVKHPGFSVAPRPVFGHGLVFACTGYMLPELLAIRPEGTGDITATGVAWKTDKGVPAKPSPLLVGDELYLITDAGLAICYDATQRQATLSAAIGGQVFGLADRGRRPHLLLRRGRSHVRLCPGHDVSRAGDQPARRTIHGFAGRLRARALSAHRYALVSDRRVRNA